LSDVIFSAEHISYSYLGTFKALEDVSFQIASGERVALLGANGCGKSTLLRILDGLIFPDTGRLIAFGTPITEETLGDENFSLAFRQRVGFVFQNADAQLFNPTVWDEIAFGPLHLGLPAEKVKQRVQDVLAMLGLERLAGRAPYQLSGGEKRKVAIASVLAVSPEVLLLDEPTSGLDPRTEMWVVELLDQLHRAGRTILVATHHLHMLEDLADRALVFSEDHRLVADRPVRQILGDRDLLISANLMHEHAHGHGAVAHTHLHETIAHHD
jgi:cobalt/nickel transport system ATP-binding protein